LPWRAGTNRPPRIIIDNHKRWRDRADEIRALAMQITDIETKGALLDIAKVHDRSAELAQKRKSAH